MSRMHKNHPPTHRLPHRGDIFLIVDRDENHDKDNENQKYENSLEAGTRTCIVVSNNMGNTHSPNIEIVYTTTKKKNKLPTHFITESTPRRSTVMCEAVMTVPKTDLTKYYGALSPMEITRLNRCLRISLGL